jgi:carboxyl-terminal processing protease
MSGKKIVFLCTSSLVLVAFISAALFGQNAPKDNIYRYLSVFTEVFSLVRSNYVEEVPSQQLIEGAFAGVTDAVDEYSYYVAPAQMAAFEKRATDGLETTGIVVSKRYGYGYVVAVVDDSPADKAGVEAGDFLEKIDTLATQKAALWEIESALAKPDSSAVKLTILRSGMSNRSEITVKRAPYEAPLPSAKSYGSVAYVRIPTFSKGATASFVEQLGKLRAAGTKKLVVDVRGTASGSSDEAIAAADHVLREGLITSLVGRKVDGKSWTADKAVAYEGDLIVLTDHSTAGAGELFASAVHGNKRGRTVGLTTYGKAIHQKFVALPSGGGLNITIGHFTTPDGKAIKQQGIRPDVVVDMTPVLLDKNADKKAAEDLILNKALALFGEAPVKAAA